MHKAGSVMKNALREIVLPLYPKDIKDNDFKQINKIFLDRFKRPVFQFRDIDL